MATSLRGTLYVLISTIAFGSMGVLAKGLYTKDFSPLFVLSWRFLIGALALLLIILARRESVKTPKEEARILAVLGLLTYPLFATLYFLSVYVGGASLAALVFSIFPAFVCLIKFFVFKQTIGRMKLLCLFFSLVALFLLSWSGGVIIDPLGILLSLLGAFFYAIYTVLLSHEGLKKLPTEVVSFHICWETGLVLTTLSLLRQEFFFPSEVSVWGILLLLGVLSTAVAVLFFALGVRDLGAVRASILSNFEAVFAACLAVVLLNEHLSAIQWAGAFLMVLSILGVSALPDEKSTP